MSVDEGTPPVTIRMQIRRYERLMAGAGQNSGHPDWVICMAGALPVWLTDGQ
jgi:hypothetical protein